MNGDEIERVEKTFRYELESAMKPVIKSMESVNTVLVEHGEDIVQNRFDIGRLQTDAIDLKNKKTTVSGKILAVVLGIPTCVLAYIAVLNHIRG